MSKMSKKSINKKENRIYAKYKSARVSPKKVIPVLNLIRGKDFLEAEKVLKFDQTKAAKLSFKVLRSALANAKHSFNIGKDQLVVSEARVDEGSVHKWRRISGKSRFSPILKRTSHIIIGLSEKQKQSKTKSKSKSRKDDKEGKGKKDENGKSGKVGKSEENLENK